MAEFEEFLRYGIPGYLVLVSLTFGLIDSNILNELVKVYGSEFLNYMAAVYLVIGPVLGYILHQIYFLYFETLEGYDTKKRPCISRIRQLYLRQNDSWNLNEKEQIKFCYFAWRYCMENKPAVFTERTLDHDTRMWNFAHSLGSGAIACGISIAVYSSFAIWSGWISQIGAFVFGFYFATLLLFIVKRETVRKKIKDFEVCVVNYNWPVFREFLDKNKLGFETVLME